MRGGTDMETANRWDALPDECKSMILSRLSTKEIARLARVSTEFLRAVNVLRSSVQLLVLPPNLSPSAMEGMVLAHPNVKSLSFKRCGGKVKTFVPIIKAAATGFVTATETDGFDAPVRDKNKIRSLTSIDFRNCTSLIDTDVSILCSLHTRLEEINLNNCPFMTDTALVTLSRYQHVDKPIDPLEKYTCYPRMFDKFSKASSDSFTESEEMFLKDNDAAVFEEIQGLGLSSSTYRSWPRLGERSRKESAGSSQFSGRRHDEGKLPTASPYSGMTKRDGNSSVSASTVPKKSYAQMAAKSLGKLSPTNTHPREMEKVGSPYENQGSPQAAEPSYTSPMTERVDADSLAEQSSKHQQSTLDPCLTFIDWSLAGLDKSSRPHSDTLSDLGLLTGSEYRSSTPSLPYVDDRMESEIAATNRYRDMYKRYLIDEVDKPARALPELIDKLCLNAAGDKGFTQDHIRSALPAASSTSSGTHYNMAQTAVYSKEMVRTQGSLFIPTVPLQSLDGTNGAGKLKAVCIADGIEIRDQRIQVDHPQQTSGKQPLDGDLEAYCRTVNHVGIFAVPNAVTKSHRRLSDATDDGNFEGAATEYLENGRHSSLEEANEDHIRQQLQLFSPDSEDSAALLRKAQLGHLSPSSPTETVDSEEKSDRTDPHLDLDESIPRSIPGLRTVSVGGCPEITDRGVQALLKGVSRPCLATLDVSRCGGVTNAALKLPARSGLQNLIANQMPAINRLVFQLPSQSVLQTINLAACQKLEELILVAPSLKTLNLSNCKRLTRLHLKCPSLTNLNLSLCVAARFISVAEPVGVLKLLYCGPTESLERFNKFQCNALRLLNATGCRVLSQSALNSAVDSASGLEELLCGGCDRVERLDLVQSSLLTVDVSGNQSLKRLYCRSKILRTVDACGCKTLAEVYLFSPYLRRMLFSNCALLQVLVIPLDAIKETIDTAASQRQWAGGKIPEELEISISGCNMPEAVKKNLAKLAQQWQSCFRSTPDIVT